MSINSVIFINRLIEEGYTHLCVVPCSFAKGVINASINNKNIEYISCASEAVACSIAAGLKISGAQPVVIVQSSGLANMASCITSLIKPYDIFFPILSSWRTYKEGDSEIQHKHLATKLPDLIEAYGFHYEILDSTNLDKSIGQVNKCQSQHQISIIEEKTFTSVELDPQNIQNIDAYIPRSAFLKKLNTFFANREEIFVGTTGNTSREMFSLMNKTDNFYMAGNMGGALSLGLGIAKSGKSVVVCGGDAEFVMHLGGLTTTGRYANDINLTYILFDNEQNKSTGGQNSYQGHLNYIAIAKSCGFRVLNKTIFDTNTFEKAITKLRGLNFIHVKCNIDKVTPRPPIAKIKRNEI